MDDRSFEGWLLELSKLTLSQRAQVCEALAQLEASSCGGLGLLPEQAVAKLDRVENEPSTTSFPTGASEIGLRTPYKRTLHDAGDLRWQDHGGYQAGLGADKIRIIRPARASGLATHQGRYQSTYSQIKSYPPEF